MPPSSRYRPAPVHPSLGDGFFDVVAPARFPQHRLRFRNQRWAARVGLDALEDAEWEAHFARFSPLADNLPSPLSLRYHGHQFGVYNPNLGDGRGFLFAQLRDADDGRLLDLGTKGSGSTPWSRGGDGRLTLKGGVREVLATEMLEALGVSTSKTFSLFETGEMLMRGDEPSPTRSSVLVRLGHSHVRFGTFQRFAFERDEARLGRLLDFSIEHYLPGVRCEGRDDTVTAFLRDVTRRAADLAASLMIAGFVHGVLNTDNLNITGESFDYGPYRFLPRLDPAFTAAYFDETGFYAYGRQPSAIVWSLTRLAEALRPLCPAVPLAPALREFAPAYEEARRRRLLARLGLASNGPDLDATLDDACTAFLIESGMPFDRFFFDWYGGLARAERALEGPMRAHYTGAAFDALRGTLELYLPASRAVLESPYARGEGPCGLLIDEIERIWAAIDERDDWSELDRKVAEIRAFGEATEQRLGTDA